MRIDFKTLVLEITRKCNMRCEHCLRGDDENISINLDVLEALFKTTAHIGQLLITGGEPTLAAPQIHYLLHYAKSYGCSIDHFHCLINGKEFDPDFLSAMNELYHYCESPDKCQLAINADQFHEKLHQDALHEYRSVPYLTSCRKDKTIPKRAILAEGRAAENNIGHLFLSKKEYLYDVTMKGWNLIVIEPVYINVLGDVLLDTDLSYKNQANYSVGNILEEELSSILSSVIYPIAEEKGTFYKLLLRAEAGTIASSNITEEKYFYFKKKATAAYHNLLRNILVIPSLPGFDLPDDLSLSVKDTTKHSEGNAFAASTIHYREDGCDRSIGFVRVSLKEIRLEDAEE